MDRDELEEKLFYLESFVEDLYINISEINKKINELEEEIWIIKSRLSNLEKNC